MKNDLKNKTSEKLNLNLKVSKIIIGLLIVGILLIVGVSIYGLLIKGISGPFLYLLLIAFSASLIIPASYMYVKKIERELKSRI